MAKSKTTLKRYVVFYRRPTRQALAAQRSYLVVASDGIKGGGSLATIVGIINPHNQVVTNHPAQVGVKAALSGALQYLDALHLGYECSVTFL